MATHAPAPRAAAFLTKVYTMVDDPLTNDVIRWSDAGDSFIVLDPKRLVQYILPELFKHDNFSSFARLLDRYNFERLTPEHQTGTNASSVEFRNRHFIRNRPELLLLLERKGGFTNGHPSLPVPNTAPNPAPVLGPVSVSAHPSPSPTAINSSPSTPTWDDDMPTWLTAHKDPTSRVWLFFLLLDLSCALLLALAFPLFLLALVASDPCTDERLAHLAGTTICAVGAVVHGWRGRKKWVKRKGAIVRGRWGEDLGGKGVGGGGGGGGEKM